MTSTRPDAARERRLVPPRRRLAPASRRAVPLARSALPSVRDVPRQAPPAPRTVTRRVLTPRVVPVAPLRLVHPFPFPILCRTTPRRPDDGAAECRIVPYPGRLPHGAPSYDDPRPAPKPVHRPDRGKDREDP
ncbi:hypothetical protein [Streptomyces sp. NPDC060243]|uniref:hypothetical protein n=1 Tax=Streptomyces sp. NPDC060243 TaxID=3347081 RepID=UPI00365AD726